PAVHRRRSGRPPCRPSAPPGSPPPPTAIPVKLRSVSPRACCATRCPSLLRMQLGETRQCPRLVAGLEPLDVSNPAVAQHAETKVRPFDGAAFAFARHDRPADRPRVRLAREHVVDADLGRLGL